MNSSQNLSKSFRKLVKEEASKGRLSVNDHDDEPDDSFYIEQRVCTFFYSLIFTNIH
jgi:hypothetical protein